MAKKLIIAAQSARGFAQAAAACGYEVIALDAFIDADTQAFSIQTFKLKFNHFALDAADFKCQFEEMASSINLDEVEGFLCGSLFDDCPELLAWVATQVRVLGNTPEVMLAAKNFAFFKLQDELGIRHPEVSFILPNEPEQWLSKKIGGTGGTHIKPATDNNSSDYFQRKIDGRPISMLFVADGASAKTIGFNEQFIAPTSNMPYRFAGAVGGLVFPKNVQQQFNRAAQQLTTALGLRGICSLDAILAKDSLEGEKCWILELNPRLSATFHLYPNLLPAHLLACAGELIAIDLPANTSNAQLILYADNSVHIPADFAWPNWVADIPAVIDGYSSVIIQKDAPICTLQATANNADAARILVLQRAKNLRELLND